MPPAIAVKSAPEPSPPRPSRFKSLSAFLNPFSSTSSSASSTITPFPPPSSSAASSSQTAPSAPSPHKALTPSAPLPYHSAKTDISLTDLGHIALGGSPFRVYVNDSPASGLPSTGLSGTPRRDSAATTAVSNLVSGLPLSRYPLAELSRSSYTPPLAAEEHVHDLRTTCREMPSLASAIHIADAPGEGVGGGSQITRDQAGIIASAAASSSTVSGPTTRPRLGRRLSMVDVASDSRGLPRSVSSTSSMFDAYRNRKSLRRASSRSSTKGEAQSSSQVVNARTDRSSAAIVSGLPRRMSRRLSFDSIRHSFAGTSRKREKDKDLAPLVDVNASLHAHAIAPFGNGPQPRSASMLTSEQGSVSRQHRLALPPMRSLRNKFSVGNAKAGTTLALAKADVAARRRNVHAWDEVNVVRRSSSGGGQAGGSASLSSTAGRGALRRMEEAAAHPLQQPTTDTTPVPTSDIQQATIATLPSEAELHLPKMDQRRASMLAHPACSPRPVIVSPPPIIRPPSMADHSSAHTAAQIHTPASQLVHKVRKPLPLPPSRSRASLLFSPAQDDRSILDPTRTPAGTSRDEMGVLPGMPEMPLPPPREEAEDPPTQLARTSETLEVAPPTTDRAEERGRGRTAARPAAAVGVLARPSPSAAVIEDEDNTSTAVESGNDSDSDREGFLLRTAKRQQSLSEIKQAFSRMRDLSGLDVSEMGSVPCSRRTSEMPSLGTSGSESDSISTERSLDRPQSDTSLVDPTCSEVTRTKQDHPDRTKGITSQPSLDLSGLDRGLAEIVSESMRCVAGRGSPAGRDVFGGPKALGQGASADLLTRRTAENDGVLKTGNPPAHREGVSQSSSASSGMITAHTSLVDIPSPFAPDRDFLEHDRHEQTEDETLTCARSGRSWHTAQDHDLPSPPTSNSRRTLLPHSKSRSTHDLASLASGKNLVDQMERTQGEGWWSVDRPSLARRASNVDSLRRRFDERDHARESDEAERRLEALERLARGSAASHRQSMDQSRDLTGGIRRGSAEDSPGSAARRAGASATPDRITRPISVVGGRAWPRTTMVDRIRDRSGSSTPSARIVHGGHEHPVVPWRPSSVQPRIRATYHGPRPSLVARSTWRSSGTANDGPPMATSEAVSVALLGDDTPTKPGRKGLNKISPDIARRASCLAARSVSGQARDDAEVNCDGVFESPLRVRARVDAGVRGEKASPTSQRRNTANDFETIKARHALELDAILGALGESKAEAARLRGEVGALKKELRDCESDRDAWRERAGRMASRMEALEGEADTRSQHVGERTSYLAFVERDGVLTAGRPTRGRSASVTSNILPDLPVPDHSLLDASPLPFAPFSPDDDVGEAGVEGETGIGMGVDEFGRKRESTVGMDKSVHGRSRAMYGWGDRGTKHGTVVSDLSLEASMEGNDAVSRVSTCGQEEDSDDPEWTLRLRRDDEAHLNDL